MKGQLLSWSTITSSDGGGNYYNQQLSQNLPKFVAVLDEYEYNDQTVEEIISQSSSSSSLQGILVLNHTAFSSSTTSSTDAAASVVYSSPESTSPRGQDTPSQQLTPDNQYEWNPNGDGLIHKNMYGIPTGYVEDARIAEYINAVSKQQAMDFLSSLSNKKVSVFDEQIKKFPPIMAEFNMYMGPEEMDSPTCLRWNNTDGSWSPKCLPLGGTSVWALAGSPYDRTQVISSASNGGDNNNRKERRVEDGQQSKQPVILVATNMDATAMFHELARGANTAAANILTVLMAAKLFGESVSDSLLDSLPNKVMFAFFQGENYGYMGSRSFLRDVAYPGFQCDENSMVASQAKNKNVKNTKMACLHPLRHDLDFMDIGAIKSMIAVDQVGILSEKNTFYVHNTGHGYYNDIITSMSTDNWTIQDATAGSIPPTPLSSLLVLSEGQVGGIVLTGYNDAFVENSFYMSHMDSTDRVSIDLDAIAKAATIVARTALAAAYGNTNDGSAISAITELTSDDGTLNKLANCLFENGNCKYLMNYASMERSNDKVENGVDLGIGQSLGKPPSYYPSVYDFRNGQPGVQLDGKVYGGYTGDKVYGENTDDKFLIRPSMLAMSIHGLLNDFLGRSAANAGSNTSNLQKCQSTSDCSSIEYCSAAADKAVCTGSKLCVCSRSHYHFALDEAIIPSPNNGTGVFTVSEDDTGVSPMYTEPYWSNDIGVQVFRASSGAANWTLGIGIVVAIACVAATITFKKHLHKEMLY
jgi:nicastrin